MYESLLFVHLVAVSFWLGGQLFLLAVVVPAVRNEDPQRRAQLLRAVGQRYGVVSIPVLLTILVTGIAMAGERELFVRGVPTFDHKLVAVAVVLASTVLHVVAARHQWFTASRVSTAVTGAATLVTVWLAVRI